jgi:hypothetical protein
MADSSGSTSPLAADLASSLHLAAAASSSTAHHASAGRSSTTTSAHRRHLEHDDSSSTSGTATSNTVDSVGGADANDVEAPALPPHKRVRCSSQSVVVVTPDNAASSVDEDVDDNNNNLGDLAADRVSSAHVHPVRGVDTDGWLRSSPQHLNPFVQPTVYLFFFFFFVVC